MVFSVYKNNVELRVWISKREFLPDSADQYQFFFFDKYFIFIRQ